MKRKIIAIVVTVVLITLLISNIYIKAFAEEKKGTYTIIATPPITTDRARKLKEKELKEKSGRGSIFTELYQGKDRTSGMCH